MSPPETAPLIDVAVRRRIGGFMLDAAFRAGAGITALFGPSGAGKTSLVNLMAGLARPDAGRIEVAGRVLFDSEAGIDLRPEARRVGYVFQDARLFPHLTVARNLTYGERRTPPGERHVSRDEIVALLGLGALVDRRPATLSGGEIQRAAIGRALLTSPRLLLMDEPLANLDPARRGEILPFIERLRDALGLPIVYVTHNMDELIRLADTVVLMSEGRVAAAGAVEDLMSRFELRGLVDSFDIGAVMPATVARHDPQDHLTELSVPGGALVVPRVAIPEGAHARVRIRARDVAIALERPRGVSVLNMFEGEIVDLGPAADGGAGLTDLLLDVAQGAPGGRLWARITNRSLRELGLARGMRVHALVKAVALDRQSVAHEASDEESLDR